MSASGQPHLLLSNSQPDHGSVSAISAANLRHQVGYRSCAGGGSHFALYFRLILSSDLVLRPSNERHAASCRVMPRTYGQVVLANIFMVNITSSEYENDKNFDKMLHYSFESFSFMHSHSPNI